MSTHAPALTQAAWRPGVFAGAAGDDLMILDLEQDRYLCLPFALEGPAGSEGRRLRRDAAAELAREGLLLGLGPRTVRAIAPPAEDLPPAALAPISPRDLWRAAGFLRDFLFRYRGRSLVQLIRDAEQGRRALAPVPPRRALAEDVSALRRALVLAPLPRKCLLQSYLLLLALRRRGHDARWVFAARGWPFAAHCWLQVGSMALDDHHERLAAYAPLLAV